MRSIFMHADGVDRLLMILGLFGSLGDGFSTPLVLLITSKLMNNIGGSPTSAQDAFLHNINKNAVALLYLACGGFVCCFLEGYCWTRTGERQAARMRVRYLKAVLRQDVGYFDLHVTSTSEVITSVSNDSLVIQDVLSEKLPNFVMNSSMFFGSYIAAFIMMWRLAIVGFPFVVLLVIPGLIYGRTLMGLARQIREEYNKAGNIAEQAISSIRTVYAFVGENKTISEFSVALQGSVKLGLSQGLAKGLAIGSNGVVFAIWSFMSYYGSTMVMYHSARGGTVFAVGAAIAVGGLALGSGLSNLKYFSEACSAAERIMEVIRRVPKIDSDNMEGECLEDVSGEVEFKHLEFAYPSRPESIIFKDFNLTIPAGKTVALVGGSGSGKSTVISLLQRFYDPLGGEVLLDGVAINKLQLKWLRSQMGLVSQEPALFATSIKENILFGKEDAEIEEVIEAGKAANAHNFISQLPQGYDTQLRNVHFAYPARPDVMIFNGFSIKIEAGKSTALVGQSGSGKSTIIGLIERFYDPIKGAVKIDGQDVKSYHLKSLRKHIALVSQEPTLFAGTIRENIVYGVSDKVDELEIVEAARAANAHDFIAGLKDGYDTSCGDRGVQLSGGQKQRIAIARAILRNPVILLLDEATSALDSRSEKVVQDALERVMVGRTSVVVAHRLSTIQNCDMITVLDKGKVVEKGTHSSLLAKGPAGAYFSLVSLQRTPPNYN
ncbi:hypothetical protein C1H46_027504 [Malus baccata]|uniref:Uncharacterized protein n=2 Tax=Malus baccata TaxID=106549 RepID=A0A540LK80_MALBA|nr:hypothetical protein C1H46_027504 [Malus baccata]